MEPLDMELAKKLSRISKEYNSKKETKDTNSNPDACVLEQRLRRYVENVKMNAHPHMKRRKDPADYKLTKYILGVIEDSCLCTLEDIRYPHKRDSGLAVVRAIYARLERNLNKRSYPEIGAIMNKDHTSIMYMVDRLRTHKENKLFKILMKDDRLRRLYECANKGVWTWEQEMEYR